MKLLIIGDLHLRYTPPINRTNEFYNDLLNKIKEIKQIQLDNNIEDENVICLGDVFDNFVVDYAEKIIYDVGPYIKGWTFLIGNHDCKEENGDTRGTTFGILQKLNIIKVKPIITKDNHILVFFNYYNRNQIYKYDFNFKEIIDVTKIAFIHDYIVPNKIAKKYNVEDIVTCENMKTDFDYIFCGHYHYSYDITHNNTRFINPGALLRKTIDKDDMKRKVKVILYNSDSEEKIKDIYLKSCRNYKDVFKIDENDIIKKDLDSKFIQQLQDIKLYGNSFNDVINLLKTNNVDNNIINYIKDMENKI